MGRQPPNRTLASRVLAAFALVVVAFVATVIVGLMEERSASADLAALSRGYLPLQIALARLQSTEGTVASQLDRLLDEPKALSTTRNWLLAVPRIRPAVLAQAREAAQSPFASSADPGTRALGPVITKELDEIERELAEVSRRLPELFAAVEGSDNTRAEPMLKTLSDRERKAAARLSELTRVIDDRRKALVENGAVRDRNAMILSIVLALFSLLSAAIATREVQQRLAPLAQLTARTKAIAAGDRSPLPRELLPPDDGSRRTDEITELAIAFAAMVDGVASRDADLGRLRRRQEDIVNHLRAAVLAVRGDGVVIVSNPAAKSMLGATDGARLAECSPELWQLVAADVDQALRTMGEAIQKEACTLETTDRKRVVDLRVVAMRASEQDRLALLVVDDVSEAAEARARALQAERLAAIGKMAAHITHEIRNPLSSMGLNLELLEETLGHVSPEARRLLDAISRELGRLADVSEEYLRVARLPSPRLARLDVSDLLTDIVAFAKPEFERARIVIHDETGTTPIWARVDESQLRQAIINLLRNAREALDDGGNLWLSLRADHQDVVLCIEDDGAGIPEEVRARIFDPFFTTKPTGTGLGLPLTKQIVEAHHGQIGCYARAPHGTRFELRFPTCERVESAELALS